MTTPPPPPAKPRLALLGEGERLAGWSAWLGRAGHPLTPLDPARAPSEHATALADCAAVFDVSLDAGAPRMQRLQALGPWLPPGIWIASTDTSTSASALAVAVGVPVALVGDWVPPWESALFEVALAERMAAAERERAIACLSGLGGEPAFVGDQVGLVFARSLAMLVNEAAFALQEGVASAADIDLAMTLGANYPHGPLAWADQIGLARVLAVIEGLAREFADPRYRPAPLLRRLVLLERGFYAAAGANTLAPA